MQFADIYGTYSVGRGVVPLSDSQIAAALWFPEWGPRYREWPMVLWYTPGEIGCLDSAKNAFHCLYFALLMRGAGGWLWEPLTVKPSGEVHDGSHRLRSAQWLQSQGFILDVPFRVSESMVRAETGVKARPRPRRSV